MRRNERLRRREFWNRGYGGGTRVAVRICVSNLEGIAIIAFSNRAHVPSHVLVRFLDNEAVLLNLASERYFGLDQTGTRMWQLATSAASIDAAYQELLAEYDVAPELLRENLDKLLLELVENGLLEMRPTESAVEAPPL